MGWGLTRTQCQCNGSDGTATQESPSSKQILQACPPVITAAMKSTCGAKRMLVSVVILIFLLAAIYWVSLHQQASPGVRRPMRIQPQASRNMPGQTEAVETTER